MLTKQRFWFVSLAFALTVKAAAMQVALDVAWRGINVLDELDYTIELGVLTLPAVVIDGKLCFLRYRPRYS